MVTFGGANSLMASCGPKFNLRGTTRANAKGAPSRAGLEAYQGRSVGLALRCGGRFGAWPSRARRHGYRINPQSAERSPSFPLRLPHLRGNEASPVFGDSTSVWFS